MVRRVHSSDHASPARVVLLDCLVGSASPGRNRAAPSLSNVVFQAAPDLQRRARACPARTLGQSRFPHIRGRGRDRQNSSSHLQRIDRRSLLCCVDGQSRAEGICFGLCWASRRASVGLFFARADRAQLTAGGRVSAFFTLPLGAQKTLVEIQTLKMLARRLLLCCGYQPIEKDLRWLSFQDPVRGGE